MSTLDMFAPAPVAQPDAPGAPLQPPKPSSPQSAPVAPPARSQEVAQRTPVYYLNSGISTWAWLCPKHVVARKRRGWDVKATGAYAAWGCDDCPRKTG